MKKTIVKVGSSMGIIFSKQERENYNIGLGDILNLEDAIFIKKKRGKKDGTN